MGTIHYYNTANILLMQWKNCRIDCLEGQWMLGFEMKVDYSTFQIRRHYQCPVTDVHFFKEGIRHLLMEDMNRVCFQSLDDTMRMELVSDVDGYVKLELFFQDAKTHSHLLITERMSVLQLPELEDDLDELLGYGCYIDSKKT